MCFGIQKQVWNILYEQFNNKQLKMFGTKCVLVLENRYGILDMKYLIINSQNGLKQRVFLESKICMGYLIKNV